LQALSVDVVNWILKNSCSMDIRVAGIAMVQSFEGGLTSASERWPWKTVEETPLLNQRQFPLLYPQAGFAKEKTYP
jgi:hypothetical protein